MFVITSLLLAGASLVSAQTSTSTFSPLRPPSIPLAVKSPWMNTWLPVGSDNDAGSGGTLPGFWPRFWDGQITGWAGMIRVDGVNYVWMGDPADMSTYVTQTAFTYTSTRSIFTMDVNNQVSMNVTFLSNVTPDDLQRSSLPYTYVDIEVASIDGQQHDIQVYTDISGEWTSGDNQDILNWSYGTTSSGDSASSSNTNSGPESPGVGAQTPNGIIVENIPWTTSYVRDPSSTATEASRPVAQSATERLEASNSAQAGEFDDFSRAVSYHQLFQQNQAGEEYYNDGGGMTKWGYWYYSTANTAGLTFQSGQDVVVRGNFANSGSLLNTVDPDFRAISDDWPVFGFAMDFGSVADGSRNMVVMLSLHQKNCIQFESGPNIESDVPCLWNSYFDSDTEAVEFFYNDYEFAQFLADILDYQVLSDSTALGGGDYAAITTLAVRQAFGALEFTNTPENPWVFFEEISSDNNIQTVDILFPFHPIALYMNSTLLKWMMEPIFINTAAGNWPDPWAPHDLGKLFPNATGYSGDRNGGAANQEAQPVEESGNLLIMALAYAQRTNDVAFLSKYFNVLQSWADYLITNNAALIPQSQTSTDDFAGAFPNETNLAIKGIIGVGCMGKIANLTGQTDLGAAYTAIAASYIPQWLGFSNDTAASPPAFEFNYNSPNTYTLLYNIFGDAVNGLGLIPDSVYQQQSNFYPTVFSEYGVMLDTRPLSEQNKWTKADWEMFVASVADVQTFDMFTSALVKMLNETTSNAAFPDLYNVETADSINFRDRPVVGGMFAPLALLSAPPRSCAFGN